MRPDPSWPLMLDGYLERLVSAVQEWSTRAQSTPSLPDTVIEQNVAKTDAKEQQTGSSPSLPNSCSDRNRPVNGDIILSNRTIRENRATCPHDTSVDNCPGDQEMPPSPKDNTPQSPVTTNIVALQSRQSPNPPTARLAQLSDPPDEDPNGPKRVAVLCERYTNQHSKFPSPNIAKVNQKTWPWH